MVASLGMKTKDPDETLDYTVDWAEFLGADTIHSVSWTVPAGITSDHVTFDDTSATIWLVGGTVGVRYTIGCRITSHAGRIGDRTFTIKIQEK